MGVLLFDMRGMSGVGQQSGLLRVVVSASFLLVAAVVIEAGCGGSVAPAPVPVVLPTKHRDVAESCPPTRPPSITDAGIVGPPVDAGSPPPMGACSVDADCTTGTNGRCQHVGQLLSPRCTYDACAQDSDCKQGTTCHCDPSGNRCIESSCTTDAQCKGRGCSPTFESSCGVFDGVRGYYCHTPNDTCINDSDCKDSTTRNCAFDLNVGHWACASSSPCSG